MNSTRIMVRMISLSLSVGVVLICGEDFGAVSYRALWATLPTQFALCVILLIAIYYYSLKIQPTDYFLIYYILL